MINGMALAKRPGTTRRRDTLQSAIEMANVAEPFIYRRAIRHLELGQSGHIWSWDRQSLLFHGYDGSIARQ